ncbi:MAG: TonB-dependent receptor [Acidobacteriales bacterium]|nr:TonB-dependent receptor [Terriglobales bacterium]
MAHFRRLLPLLLLSLLGTLTAQSTGGRFVGHVSDSTGAAVPDARITVTNRETGVSRFSASNSNGDYTVLQVPVGSYSVTVEHATFKKYVLKEVTLSLNEVKTVDVVLQPGATTEEITVTAEAPLVDTTSTQLGAAVDAKTVTGLPLNARDTYQLLQLQPGVTSVGGADLFYGSDQSGSVSVNGGRGRTNNFSVNGGDANDLFVNAPAVQPSPDSIQEFRVITNTFDPEYGRNSGSVINVVTKSGTNDWHGSFYEFFRNKALNAVGFFDNTKPDFNQNQFGGTFGGPIKKEKTFFFVSYEGRRILQGLSSDPVVVPSSDERAGIFGDPLGPSVFAGTLGDDAVAQVLLNRPGCAAAIAAIPGSTAPAAGTAWASIFPTSTIPTSCMDPVAVALVNFYVPLSNQPDGKFQAVPNGSANEDQFTVKLDHNLNQNQQLNFYYYYTGGVNNQPFSHFQAASANVLPGFGTASDTLTQLASATHTWTINSNTVNEFRFNWFRNSQGKFLHPTRTNLVTDSCNGSPGAPFCFTGTTDTPGVFTSDPRLGITPGYGATREGVPFLSISGGFTIGNNFEGEIPQTGNSYQFSDNFTKVAGNHTMKFGGDFRIQQLDQTLYFDVNGNYSFFGGGTNDLGGPNLFPNYYLGLPDSFLQGSAQTSRYRTNAIYLYAQDSWKLKQNLTLNYGLRWEVNTPFKDLNKFVQSYRPGVATTNYPCTLLDPSQIALYGSSDCSPSGPANAVFPMGLVTPGDPGVPAGFSDTYYKAFAPRIGIAWSPGWGNNWLTGGPGKTSVRAGFGIFYNPIEQLVLEQLGAQPPFGGSTLVSLDFLQAPFALQSCTAPCAVGGPGVVPNPFGGFQSPAPGTAIDWSKFRPILLFGQVPHKVHPQYTMQYNFTIQRELSKDLAVTLAYVGAQGRRLLATRDLNFGNAQTCLDLNATLGTGTCGAFYADSSFVVPAGTTIAPQGLTLPYGSVSFIPGGTTLANDVTLVGLRPNSSPFCEPTTGAGCPLDGIPVFSSIFSQETSTNSSYNALQASLEKRFSRGFKFLAAYTWSKSMDDASTFEQILNPICARCNRSLSLFDTRHRFVVSYAWELPIPKYSGFAGKVFNGWGLTGITTFQSGFPIRILSSDDQEFQNSFDFELPGKPDQVARFVTGDPRNNSFCAVGTSGPTCESGFFYFDPNSFTTAADGTLGTAKRTICCGPGIQLWDLSIQKNTKLGDRMGMQFRAEFFNLFNHTMFNNPDGNITDGSDFGVIKRARPPRQIQFAVKFSF